MAKWKVPMFARAVTAPSGMLEADSEGIFTAKTAADDAFFQQMEAQVAGPSASPAAVTVDTNNRPVEATMPDGKVIVKVNPEPTMVVFGDSLTENGEITSATYSLYGLRGYWVHCLAAVKWPFKVVAVNGYPGETTQQLLARFNDSVAAYKPTYVLYLPLQNNLVDTDDGAAGIAALNSIAYLCRDIGTKLILGTCTPREGGAQSAQVAKNQVAFHRAVRDLARQNLCVVFDAAKAITNPSDAGGAALTGLLYDASIHHGPKGGVRIAKQFVKDLASFMPPNPYVPPLSNADCRQVNATSRQLLVNPKLIGTNGTATAPATGDVPTSYQLQLVRNATSTTSLAGTGNVADPETTGRLWYRMVFGGNNAGTPAAIDLGILNISAFFNAMLASVTAGVDEIDYARVTIKGSNVSSNFAYAKLQIEALNGSTPTFEATWGSEPVEAQGEFLDGELVFHAPGFKIPAGTTRIRANIKIGYGAGACTGTFDVTDMYVVLKAQS